MSRRSSAEQWQRPLGKFVREYGPTALAEQLDVTTNALYKWVDELCLPRPATAMRLIAVSAEFGTPLTFGDIYGQRTQPECGENWVSQWQADSK